MTARKNGGKPSQELREFQFVVQPVLLMFQDDQTPRPVNADPQVLTGIEELKAFIDAFPTDLANLNQKIRES